jgi:hypothetical protein
VGFPLNHFCKKLAELYCPLHAQDLHRVKHDSIPCVDTFEDLSDLEGGGSEPTRRDTVGGQDQDPPELPSQGGDECVSQGGGDPQPWDAKDGGCDGTVNTPPPSPAGLLGLIDGFKASKVWNELPGAAMTVTANQGLKVQESTCPRPGEQKCGVQVRQGCSPPETQGTILAPAKTLFQNEVPCLGPR